MNQGAAAAGRGHGYEISMAPDERTVLRDGRRVRIVVNGANRTVKVGCTTISFAAIERIYALKRRHEDAVTFVAQAEIG